MIVRFYIYTAKKRGEGVTLIDSDATKNFMSLDYIRWLELPIFFLYFIYIYFLIGLFCPNLKAMRHLQDL